MRPPKLLYLRTISKIQKITDTEGEGATIEEEVVKEADSGKGVKVTKKVIIKEEEEVAVVTRAATGAASKVNINLTEMSNRVVKIVEHLIEDVAPEVVQITRKIVLAEMITPTLGRKDRGFTQTLIFDLTLLATITRNQQGT